LPVDEKCKKLRTRLDGYCLRWGWGRADGVVQAVGLKSARGVE